MAIKYVFVTGEVEIVNAGAYWDNIINEMQREEWKNDRQQHRHTYSYDSIVYEGDEYGYEDNYFADDTVLEMEDRIKKVAHVLTPLQRRRVEQLCDGMTLQEIAQSEGVARQTVQESIESVRKKVQKIYGKYPDRTAQNVRIVKAGR